MESPEKIIILKHFDTAIEANLAKTKLDAYGIPCFLTDEVFNGLYPIRNEIFPGVRLNIFEKDHSEALRILEEEDTSASVTDVVQCPRCKSEKTERVVAKRIRLLAILSLLTFGVLVPAKYINKCNNCGAEFE